jgi:hypothetical protein
MERLRKAIQGKSRWDGLLSYISLVEDNQKTHTNASLDASKSILESISKTILADKAIDCKSDEKIGNLVKQAFSSLPVFAKLSAEEAQESKSILNAFATIANAIGTLRNQHGFFAHGQDLQSQKFDYYLLDLAISSSDLLASFLVISHAEDLKERSRIYYEEHDLFNRYLDERREESITIANAVITASKALFTDEEAYKEAFWDFENRRLESIQKLINSNNSHTTHRAIDELQEFRDFLSDEESIQILEATISNDQIYSILCEDDVKQFIGDLFQAKKETLEKTLRESLESFITLVEEK